MSRLVLPLATVLADTALGDWQTLVDHWSRSSSGQSVLQAVDRRVASGVAVYPGEVFRAFQATPIQQTRVVVLGQDPYHGPGQAEGLAFSVPPGQRIPPSLRNIFRELRRDFPMPEPTHGSLQRWAGAGVLLLNSALTVEEGAPGSHSRLGWQTLTDAACRALAADSAPKVFMLWGAHAQARGAALAELSGRHLLLQANHPSPLSALRPPVPFIGCGHFRRANQFLVAAGRGTVEWASICESRP